jgi:preprotein translocase subunit SecA
MQQTEKTKLVLNESELMATKRRLAYKFSTSLLVRNNFKHFIKDLNSQMVKQLIDLYGTRRN